MAPLGRPPCFGTASLCGRDLACGSGPPPCGTEWARRVECSHGLCSGRPVGWWVMRSARGGGPRPQASGVGAWGSAWPPACRCSESPGDQQGGGQPRTHAGSSAEVPSTFLISASSSRPSPVAPPRKKGRSQVPRLSCDPVGWAVTVWPLASRPYGARKHLLGGLCGLETRWHACCHTAMCLWQMDGSLRCHLSQVSSSGA